MDIHRYRTRLPHGCRIGCARVPRQHHVCVGGAADAAYVPIRAVAVVLPVAAVMSVIATLSAMRHMRRSVHAGCYVHRRPHRPCLGQWRCGYRCCHMHAREGAGVHLCPPVTQVRATSPRAWREESAGAGAESARGLPCDARRGRSRVSCVARIRASG